MQKIAVILLVLLVSACHKEFISTTDNEQKLMVRNNIISIVPRAETKALNWELMEAIESNGTVIGYKVPFENNTSNSYSFILANYSNNEVGTLYRNQISYASFSGGKYPITINNYNYSSTETIEFDTKRPIDQLGLKMGALLPTSLLSIGLHFPAVTSCEVVNENADENNDTLLQIDTYILGYLLGFEEIETFYTTSSQKSTLPYYNPLALDQLSKERKAIMAWDISK